MDIADARRILIYWMLDHGANAQAVGTFNRAVIETTHTTHVFQTTKEMQRLQIPTQPLPTVGVQERATFEGWRVDVTV